MKFSPYKGWPHTGKAYGMRKKSSGLSPRAFQHVDVRQEMNRRQAENKGRTQRIGRKKSESVLS